MFSYFNFTSKGRQKDFTDNKLGTKWTGEVVKFEGLSEEKHQEMLFFSILEVKEEAEQVFGGRQRQKLEYMNYSKFPSCC